MKCFINRLPPLLMLLIASFAAEALGKPAAPVGLLVNGVKNPLAVDRNAMRFTWMSKEGVRGQSQTAYQIRVASSLKALAAGKADLWDSGKVDSDNSASVEYAGEALPPATRFWWKVRIWDQTGKPGDFSEPDHFDTGLATNEWTASYVWDGTTNLNNFTSEKHFRLTPNQISRRSLSPHIMTICSVSTGNS